MQEAVATDITLVWFVAENQAINTREELIAVLGPVTGRTEFLRMLLRQLNAPWRVRVTRKEVQAGVAGAAYVPQLLVAVHGAQEASRCIRIKPGAADGADPDIVSFKLLVSRELRKLQLAAYHGGAR